MGQDDAVLVRLEPQRSDQVPAPAPSKSDLVYVHRRRVRLEDAVAGPLLERGGGALVISAGPDQTDDVVRRKRAIPLELGLGDNVIGRRDENA
jgi:hypothetical protein